MYETKEAFFKEKISSRNIIFYNFIWNHMHRSVQSWSGGDGQERDCKLESVQRRAGKVTKIMEIRKVTEGA